jgi:hypothetical protein
VSGFDASWAARLVRAFDLTGVHRASTAGDYASGEWICTEARAAGAHVLRMEVDLPRTEVDEAYVECGGRRIDGMPMFDSPATDGFGGRLGRCGDECEIGYLELPPNAASIKGMAFEKTRRETRHKALIAATRVAGDSLAPINAQFFGAPLGPPVLLVAGMHHERLAAWAGEKREVRIVSRHSCAPANSYNVVAHLSATHDSAGAGKPGHSGAPALVLITPRTGWWESTAERAGGLVAWLAGLRAAAALRRADRLAADIQAIATCGHELGHVGLHALLRRRASLLHERAPWLHLGANLGCASNESLMLRASDEADARHMRALLIDAGYAAESIRIEPITAVSGEGRDVVEHGGRVLSLAGSNTHFHAASDRWPANVSAANVAAIARAVGRWVEQRASP